MQIGVDVCHEGKESIVGLSATYTAAMTQHFSKTYPQKLHEELIGKSKGQDFVEEGVTFERT